MLLGLCTECDKPVCSMCRCCSERHTIILLSDVAMMAFPTNPDDKHMRAFVTAAQRHIPNARMAAADTLRTERDSECKADMHDEFVDDVDCIRAQGPAELAHTRSELNGVRESVKTVAAMAALADAGERLEAKTLNYAKLAQHDQQFTNANIAFAHANGRGAAAWGLCTARNCSET
eukprot:gnl/Chilomastix_cuspidata/4257.p1 GENE.gnl/Chilomastix_cuspidata/4257~~gnl/Chilomastix_cuspidata/4257.p1  ORF type:complete len:176 (-),score=28.08 gnl/Chilomastix_cuspidata/4257:611-1138(-)